MRGALQHSPVSAGRKCIDSGMVIRDPALLQRIHRLHLQPRDFEEVFASSSGPGGQNVNKVETAATLLHRASGVRVTARDSRSQFSNRQAALRRLIEILEERQTAERVARRAAREKQRRRNSPRPRSLKQELRREKERRSEVKRGRTRVEW